MVFFQFGGKEGGVDSPPAQIIGPLIERLRFLSTCFQNNNILKVTFKLLLYELYISNIDTFKHFNL